MDCLNYYNIGITITNFEKLNLKIEIYLTLNDKSIHSLYSIVKDGFLELVEFKSLGHPKSHN